ncbi:MAG: hypothetical protein GX452_09130 [Ignavibacteriales bacterium]|jgi:hypothetical protein|nr:hypothetical protein [Ignavibacteriaceae bacterium]NLH61556.1 hypothetical protein [Ignavibacteriales bacterium]
MKIKLIFLLTIVLITNLFPQVESALQVFTRGSLWHSVLYGKSGSSFNDWKKSGPSLDWPAFDASWIREDIGGSPTHLATGGFIVGAKKTNDSVLVVEDWSIYAGTVSTEQNAKYIVKKHGHKYKNGENYFLKKNDKEGEEVIETIWEYNTNYIVDSTIEERQLPLRVTRRVHQWSGNAKDENYILYEYIFKNIYTEIKQIAPDRHVVDSLKDFIATMTYAMHSNSRAWTVIFPQLSSGARNTWFFYDSNRKMMYGRAADYPLSTSNEEFGFSPLMGRVVNGKVQGEYLAPGYVGVRLLYSSKDKTGGTTRVAKYGWSAGNNTLDLQGPLTGVPGTNEGKYAMISDISNAYQYVTSPADTTFMRKNRMWSLMTLGPWDLAPGDSIVIAVAEGVNGADYSFAIDPTVTSSKINTEAQKAFNLTMDKAKFTYDQYLAGYGLNHPDPPPAPKFTVEFSKGEVVANSLTWGNEAENVPDPDDGIDDLIGYRIYRSDFLPIGPWVTVANIVRSDPTYYDLTSGKYTYIDTAVQIGLAYYYSIVSYDTGRASWSVNPTARIPETNSNRVPPLESSIFANRTLTPFLATLKAKDNPNEVLVVPNPFVIGEGFSRPGDSDQIQFVNVPNPSSIRIYTIRGDLVKKIEVGANVGGIVTWDQTSDYGQYVESGIYIFHVESPSGIKIGKLAIVR